MSFEKVAIVTNVMEYTKTLSDYRANVREYIGTAFLKPQVQLIRMAVIDGNLQQSI